MTAIRSDAHRLVYYPQTIGLTQTTTGEAFVLLQSETPALPFGWLFLFGSRNIWEPGESVSERGGAAAERDPAVTPMDVALVRLQEASRTLNSDEHLKPLCVTLELLERMLSMRGEQGQLRLQSPTKIRGAAKDAAEHRRIFLETVALAETLIFTLGGGKRENSRKLLLDLKKRCDFVPSGDLARDSAEMRKRKRSFDALCSLEQAAVRCMIGWPVQPAHAEDFSALAGKTLSDFSERAAKARSARPWWKFWG
jgi:hypothetical protein